MANSLLHEPQKLIIDTDPGIDDSITIMMAFESPEVEIIGMTTIFGNVTTQGATHNALLLCELAGHQNVPVAEGSPEPLKAIKRDSSFASKVKKIVVLGGSVLALGNVNPAAEANIYGDPEAADIVFTSGANIVVVGLNITTQIKFTDADLLKLKESRGKYAHLLSNMCKFYRDWHVNSDGFYGIFLHDPVSFVALVHPDLFTYKKGVMRVETQGICEGHTIMDLGLKKWNTSNPWTGYSPVSVAWTVNVDEVLRFIKERLMKSL
nr:probable uridine nucleosidase 1 isoform X4 [Arachis hypogaea]XP_029149624.1 probable uridine nucleosidase 1 isoform X4 [Arachis hypogaea]